MNTKKDQLKILQIELETTFGRELFLFPQKWSVRGFMGTGPVMFVGERSSTGEFGGRTDEFLYSLLRKCGMANAHLTDVIKTRGKIDEEYPQDMHLHKQVFDKEVAIVQPRRIVTFGKKVHDMLRFSLASSRIPIHPVWHYAYTRRGADKRLEFGKQLRRALGMT